MRDFRRLQTEPPDGCNGAFMPACDAGFRSSPSRSLCNLPTTLSLHEATISQRIQFNRSIIRSARPNSQNIMEWDAVILGPSLTIWDGSVHRLKVSFTEEYPNKPPTVVFVSRVFHPNVYDNGSICLDILQKAWSPIYDISAILTSIQSLLPDPNPDSPANAEAAKLFTDDRGEYNRRVAEIVEQSWKWDPQLDETTDE